VVDRRYVKDIVDELPVYKQVGIEEIDFFARFGAKVGSTTSNSIGIGTRTWVTDEAPTKFKVGDDVQVTALADTSCYMYGTCVAKDTGSSGEGDITLVINDVSPLDGTFADWELQVVARPKAWLEVDISLTSINPTTAGPFTMVVTAGKLFPIGGSVLLRAIEDPRIALLTRIKAYDGTSLVLTKVATTATVSTSYASWDVALIDGPAVGIPIAGLSGLRVEMVETEKVANPATLPASTGRGAAISPDDLTLAVAHDTTPFVTIYRRTAADADDWLKVANPATLPASHGFDCVISPDGLTLAVAHTTTPFVTIYRRTATSADDWTKVANPATLPAGNGIGVAISSDGLTLVVGHSTTPFVTIYRRSSAAADDWTKVANPATLPASTARHPAISPDGLTLAVPHNTTPFVTIYRRTAVGADDWTKIADPATLPASSGYAATISPDGLTLAVAHEVTPFVTIYRRTSAAADDWTKITNPTALPASHAHGCAIFPDGLVLAVAHDTTPFVTMYRRSAVAADDWTKVTNPASLPPESGTSCAISSDGLTLAVSHGTTPFVTIYRNPDAGTLVYINRGAVRSYDDSADIENEEAGMVRVHQLYEDDGLMLRAALTGTGTSAGTALTGTGTTFGANFGLGSAQAFLVDYDDQIDTILRGSSIVTAGTVSSGVASVSSDTAAVTVSDLGASGSALKRGGYTMETGTLYLGVGVALKDSDGTTARFISALTGSGMPDLPSGYTKYRIVAVIRLVDGVVTEVLQPLTGQSVPDADEIDYDNSASGLSAETVQAAIDELADSVPPTSEGSVSAQATMDIDLAPFSACRGVRIYVDVIPATNQTALQMRFSTDDGATYDAAASNYKYTNNWSTSTGAVANSSGSTGATLITLGPNVGAGGNAIGNGAAEGAHFTVEIHKHTDATRKPFAYWAGFIYCDNDAAQVVNGSGLRNNAQDTTNVRFLMSSGNITGTYKVEGIL
jgi:hypothetical protein